MFVPSQYRQPDDSWSIELMRRNPLALLASDGGAGRAPHATHLPVIPDPTMTGWPAGLQGGRLLGHMNKLNPHWAALEVPTPVVLVFYGPNGYVSPTTYDKVPAAPTWNFTSVHVYGLLTRIQSTEDTLEVVQSTVRALEPEFGSKWDMAASLDYFRQLVRGVGAFKIEVNDAQGMFKLSQEQSPEVRERVRRDFLDKPGGRYGEAAELMARLPVRGASSDQ